MVVDLESCKPILTGFICNDSIKGRRGSLICHYEMGAEVWVLSLEGEV